MEEVDFRILIIGKDTTTAGKNFFEFENNSTSRLRPVFSVDHTSTNSKALAKIKKNLVNKHSFLLVVLAEKDQSNLSKSNFIKQALQLDEKLSLIVYTDDLKDFFKYSFPSGFNDNVVALREPYDKQALQQVIRVMAKKWIMERDAKEYYKLINQILGDDVSLRHQSRSLLKAAIETSSSGLLVVDLKGNLVTYNSQFIQIWDLNQQIIKAMTTRELLTSLMAKLSKPLTFLRFVNGMKQDPEISGKERCQLKNGIIIECLSKPYSMDQSTAGRLWVFQDITERVQMEHKLAYQATHDALTKLPNRILLFDRLNHYLETHRRHNERFALLFLDLDRFKLVNDSLTHAYGDRLLCAVVKRISKLIRSSDTFARFGGDEFIIIPSSLKSKDDIVSIAHKLVDAFQKPFTINGKVIQIRTSIGIAIYPNDGKTSKQLLNSADVAMYYAKERGGDQFRFYSDSLSKQSRQRYQLEAQLQQALKRNEFYLVYQPQFSSNQHILKSAEALIRWRHPEKDEILPMNFIPTAELTGLITPIGEWVVEEACRQHCAWIKLGLPPVSIAVNISLRQIRHYDFVNNMTRIIKKHGIDPKFINIEITENTLLVHRDVCEKIKDLKSQGFKIVIDDFGRAHSSLNYLRDLKVDGIKIDSSFIKNITKDENDELVIKAMIAMANRMDFEVIAEGVETEQQVDFLKEQHCNGLQGYYFSRPLSQQKVTELFKNSFINNIRST
ncbi:sensor domain-containing protein [Legionella impletisoli]|uniref:Two-component system response regulator n=1 Tax=Legionella impletisoli TaxID=343510 RepID=A0A917JY25_9GAMM|nr:EAL domain-containing protein [Legionella impletisoli]GGI91634.1 two-component system response regulator [Legionella impletisoli]